MSKKICSITLDQWKIRDLIFEEMYMRLQDLEVRKKQTPDGVPFIACQTDSVYSGLEGIRPVTMHVYPMGEAPEAPKRSFHGLYLKRKAKR